MSTIEFMEIISGLLLIFASVLSPIAAAWMLIMILVYGFEVLTKQNHRISNKMLMMPITVLSLLMKTIIKGFQSIAHSIVGSPGKRSTHSTRSSGSSSGKTTPKPDNKPPKSPKPHK